MIFSNDDSRIISGSEDKTLKIWDAKSFELIKTLEGSSIINFNLNYFYQRSH